jgi:hypothetical protein
MSGCWGIKMTWQISMLLLSKQVVLQERYELVCGKGCGSWDPLLQRQVAINHMHVCVVLAFWA